MLFIYFLNVYSTDQIIIVTGNFRYKSALKFIANLITKLQNSFDKCFIHNFKVIILSKIR